MYSTISKKQKASGKNYFLLVILKATEEKSKIRIRNISLQVATFHSYDVIMFEMSMLQSNFFHEYNLEGVTAEQNEIYLEFTPDKLFKVCFKKCLHSETAFLI